MPLRLFLALALLTLAACRADAPPEAPPAHAQPTPQAEAPAPDAQPEETATAEVREHELRVADVQRYGRAAERVLEIAAADPELQRFQDDLEVRLSQAATIEEVQEILDAHPRVQQALREAGITSRDYVLTGTALLGAYSYVQMRDQGVPDAFRPDYVTDEHVRFVDQNRAEVDAVVARLQALYGTDFEDFPGS